MSRAVAVQTEAVAVQTEVLPGNPAPAPTGSALAILQRSIEQTTDVERLAKLWELYREWDAHEAKSAFTAALGEFKRAVRRIEKNRKVSYEAKGQTVAYKHATLDRIADVIDPELGKHGLSYRWRPSQKDGKISVTCIVEHVRGHREETTLEGPPDNTGSKNDLQAIGSTVKYLSRYTVEQAFGLADRDDSDGITFGDIEDMRNSLLSAASLDELQERYNGFYKRAFAARDKTALDLVHATRERRKGELTNPKAVEFRALADKANLNMAARNMLLGKHNNDYEKAIEELKAIPAVKTDAGASVLAEPGQAAPPPDPPNGTAGTEVAPADAGQQGPKRSAKKKRSDQEAGTTARPEPATSRPAEAAPPSSEEKKLNFGF